MVTTTETLQEKVNRLNALRDALEEVKREATMLEQAILDEMTATGATELLHPEYRVTIPTERKYDPAKVAQQAEVIPPDIFGQLYQPEREETVTVAAKVDGRVAQRLLKTEYAAVLQDCQLPVRPRLKVEPLKKEATNGNS